MTTNTVCIKCKNRLPEILPAPGDGYLVYCMDRDKWIGNQTALDNKKKGGCKNYEPKVVGGIRLT